MVLRITAVGICFGLTLGWMWSAPAGQNRAPDAITVDGGRYFGPLAKGKLHGKGRIEWADGSHYEGQFANGLYEGQGMRQDAAGHYYEGQFKAGQAHGRGFYRDPDGEEFEGEFVRDALTGKGRFKRPDGAHYEGEFRDWRFHGQGRYTAPNKIIYEGSFAKGQIAGKARMVNPAGGIYEGEVKDWLPHGQGIIRLPNGDVYSGGFAQGVYEGAGTLVYARPQADGRNRDEGEWRYGELQNPERERKDTLNVESALYHQRQLLDRAIAQLQLADPRRINLYLLAIAGDGTQEVFRREVDFVRDQFAREFGAAGRTLALVNSRHTAETAPMATLTSIEEALGAIALRMDKARDILFLFITSHGSESHEISLSQSAMRLRDLPAAELGRMVKATGIRHKVIVVSACYAGGFIDTLKDEHTLIIAAARRDRRSFGCSDDNEFTYFGRAFFKNALPASASFQAAFHTAEGLVRGWERAELEADGKIAEAEYSYPQMLSPMAIENHLRQWWAQRPSSRPKSDQRAALQPR